MRKQAVAWCAACAQAVDQDRAARGHDGRGSCPDCGGRLSPAPREAVADPAAAQPSAAVPGGGGARELAAGDDPDGDAGDGADDEHVAAPWHFKVLLVGTAGYLVYRLIWFVFLLAGHAWHG